MLGLAPLAAFFFATAVVANPVPIDLGITFGPGSDNLPVLNLPYASYKAYSYDVTDDVSSSSHIRDFLKELGLIVQTVLRFQEHPLRRSPYW